MWRVNANIEMKFALAKNVDIVRRTKLSDFMIQDGLFEKLKKDFEVIQLNDTAGGLVSNYIIDEFHSPKELIAD